jgi:hypothetical protein
MVLAKRKLMDREYLKVTELKLWVWVSSCNANEELSDGEQNRTKRNAGKRAES